MEWSAWQTATGVAGVLIAFTTSACASHDGGAIDVRGTSQTTVSTVVAPVLTTTTRGPVVASTTAGAVTSTAPPPTAPGRPDATFAAPPPTGSAATTTAPGSALRALLKRRDVPRGGIAAQAGFFAGGAGGAGETCHDWFPGPFQKPVIVVPGARTDPGSGRVEIGDHLEKICFLGFRDGPIDVAIDGPAGRLMVTRVCVSCATGVKMLDWWSFPGDPTGRYTVSATQQKQTTVSSFELVRLKQPLLIVAESPGRDVPTVRAGSTVRIGLAGFPAGSTVEVAVYWMPSVDATNGVTFVTSFPVRVDRNGEAVQRLETGASDPRGCYAMESYPEVPLSAKWNHQRMNGFCLA